MIDTHISQQLVVSDLRHCDIVKDFESVHKIHVSISYICIYNLCKIAEFSYSNGITVGL